METYIESPYKEPEGSFWIAGNLHTHTTRSDGASDPQEVIEHYASLGHGFLMLSDHDVLADYSGLNDCGMVLIPGNEIGQGPHILHLNAPCQVQPDPDRQKVIDAINASGGYAILCHPNWQSHFNHFPYEDMRSLSGYLGIEIFNGSIVAEEGEAKATEKWDRLLTAGKICWGFATDDSHRPQQRGLGWIVVRTQDRTVDAIVEAIRAGNFYASNGVQIETIRCEGPELYVKAPNAEAIAVVGESGRRLYFVEGTELKLDVSELDTSYIRVECFGFADKMAWSQPMLIRGGKVDYLRKLAEEKPVLKVLHSERPPQMTGRIDDPLWEKAPATTRFLHYKTGNPAAVTTEVRCIVAADRIFFAIRCEEPHVDAIKINAKSHGSPSIWTDDSVELFIDTEGKARRYLHVMVNAAGYTYACYMPEAEEAPAVEARAATGKGEWTVEVAIPLSQLGGQTTPGSRWGFHVCRNRRVRQSAATYMWAWVGKNNHTPERFGWLEF